MLEIEDIKKQIPYVIKDTDFPTLGKKYKGKVRDNYTKGDQRVLIVTDTLSAFDRIIALVPFKGQVLNQISEFWFEKTKDICGNHVIEFPDPNVVIAKECEPLKVEMVVRGYLTGVTSTSIWHHYEKGVRNFCGVDLPDGMKKDQKLERPIITPSTKAAKGGHDISVAREQIMESGVVTSQQYVEMAEKAMRLYERGREICAENGIILVDTKYEFGIDKDGEIILIDEIHTPDSSRYWIKHSYEERFKNHQNPETIDKDFVRLWVKDNYKNPYDRSVLINVPDDILDQLSIKYFQLYELLIGEEFKQ